MICVSVGYTRLVLEHLYENINVRKCWISAIWKSFFGVYRKLLRSTGRPVFSRFYLKVRGSTRDPLGKNQYTRVVGPIRWLKTPEESQIRVVRPVAWLGTSTLKFWWTRNSLQTKLWNNLLERKHQIHVIGRLDFSKPPGEKPIHSCYRAGPITWNPLEKPTLHWKVRGGPWTRAGWLTRMFVVLKIFVEKRAVQSESDLQCFFKKSKLLVSYKSLKITLFQVLRPHMPWNALEHPKMVPIAQKFHRCF